MKHHHLVFAQAIVRCHAATTSALELLSGVFGSVVWLLDDLGHLRNGEEIWRPNTMSTIFKLILPVWPIEPVSSVISDNGIG